MCMEQVFGQLKQGHAFALTDIDVRYSLVFKSNHIMHMGC